MIKIYTDGSSRGNPGPGGYGAILIWGNHRKEISEGFRKTTNNRMELLAVISALEAIKKDGHQIEIYTDSQYLVNSVEKGWVWNWEKKGFKGKKNPDLWKRFLKIFERHRIKFHWIKGHAGHPENERADELAVEAAQKNKLKIDTAFENQTDEPGLFGA